MAKTHWWGIAGTPQWVHRYRSEGGEHHNHGGRVSACIGTHIPFFPSLPKMATFALKRRQSERPGSPVSWFHLFRFLTLWPCANHFSSWRVKLLILQTENGGFSFEPRCSKLIMSLSFLLIITKIYKLNAKSSTWNLQKVKPCRLMGEGSENLRNTNMTVKLFPTFISQHWPKDRAACQVLTEKFWDKFSLVRRGFIQWTRKYGVTVSKRVTF